MAVIVPILSTFNAAGINAATGALGALGNSLKRMGIQAAAAAVGVKAMGAAVDFVSDSITSARDLERNLFALNTVFGELSPKMVQFTKDAASMGISQGDAARTATFLGSVLKQAGFSMGDTSTETMKLTTLAQDLATTYGYDVSEALTAMTALFRGEYDPIEKFGVALKQNEVNSLLAAKGMGNLTGQALLNAQQQVRLEQLYLRSADAQGAFAAQSGTLYGVQARLSAAFQNLQSSLGEGLLPVLARMGELLIPIVEDNGPKLGEIFKGLGQIMTGLMPLMTPILRILGDILGVIGKLLQSVAPLITMLSTGLAVVLDMLAEKLESVGRGLDIVFGFFNDIFEVTNSNFGSGFMDFLKDASVMLGRIIPGLGLFNDFMNRFEAKSGEQNLARSRAAESARLTAQAQAYFKSKEPATPGPDPDPGKIATDYVKEFYASLAEEDRKQRATLKLKSLGASEGLIESIIGSGEGWMKVYKQIIAGGYASVATVQALFAKTKSGIAEVTKAAEVAAEAAKKLQDDAKAAYKEEQDAFNARIDAINEFKAAINGLTGTLKPLAFIEREVGRFESAVVDSFGNIEQSLLEAFDDDKLTSDSLATLQKYADKEMAVLSQLAKQRDDLKAKYDLADALIKETRSAVTAYANITAMLDKQTTTVTETIQTMVDGVRLTRTSTREQIVEGKNLVDSFKEILEKTVQFGKNLKQLRALGLDKNLYKQIVDAGLEAGGATAAAIIDGGAGTVSELNSLFGQLDAVGADIAETSATVMFNNGVEIVGGLLEGLKSQDALLVSAAESMASAFATAFNAMLQNAIKYPSIPGTTGNVVGQIVGKPDMTAAEYVASQNEYLANYLATGATVDYGAASGGNYGGRNAIASTTNNVYVQAGVIANKAELPGIVIDALNTATKQGLSTRMVAI